jgi:phycocyanin-associated rod linker protein
MSVLVTSTLKNAGQLGLDAYDGTKTELRPDWSEDDLQVVFRNAYRQILGNEYLMKSERLTSAESLLRQGNITVKEFCRAIAKSDLYKSKFFYPNSNQRCVELNFKHLLGRPPYNEEEFAQHTRRIEEEGYDVEIDSYFNSVDYENKFGDNIVPYYWGFSVEPGSRTTNFTRMFRLYRGYANNDRGQVGKQAHLTGELGRNQASSIKVPTGEQAYRDKTATPEKAFGGLGNQQARVYRVEVTGLLNRGIAINTVRRSKQAYLVPYDQLSERLQQLVRKGVRIVSVRPA